MKKIRFIHTADLHIDSPFRGLSHLPTQMYEAVKESTFQAFEQVVDSAIEQNVDFVLIVGDLFDAEDRSIRAQARLRKQLERLNSANIQVIISHGNHDYIGIKQTYLQLPENTHVFNHEVETIKIHTNDGTIVHLYGFSYEQRHVYNRKINEYVKKQGADFHIGLLHGQIDGGSNQHQPYAPFTKNELLEKEFDYWALGHIHQREVLHMDPYIVYPGNTQGRHIKESGVKTCYKVELYESGETILHEVETSIIRWEKLSIEMKDSLAFHEIYHLIKSKIDELLEKSQVGMIIQIDVHVMNSLTNESEHFITEDELIEVLHEEFAENETFLWINRIQFHIKEQELVLDEFTHTLLSKGTEFLEDSHFEMATESLMKHAQATRYIERLSDEDRLNILQAAQQIIQQKLKRK